MLQSKTGASLIEIMIALLIISTAFLCSSQLLTTILVRVHEQYFLNVALNQLLSLHERLLANKDDSFRHRELADWNSDNKSLLPGGHGDFVCRRTQCLLKIQWHYKTTRSLSMTVGNN